MIMSAANIPVSGLPLSGVNLPNRHPLTANRYHLLKFINKKGA